jgi:hypothetical protein
VDAVYALDGNVAIASPFAAGPWDPTLQHGGAPSALLARAADLVCRDRGGQVVRLSVELMRPVPVGRLAISITPVREGRKLRVLEVTLANDDVVVARATAICLRATAIDVPAGPYAGNNRPPPGPEAGEPPPRRVITSSAFFEGVETRVVAGQLDRPGPATAWFRLRRPIVAGETPSALVRAAAVADFANGISSELDLDYWTFANADLTLWLHRQPIGEWICLQSEMALSNLGIGCTHSVLFDRTGSVGWSCQSLLIEPREKGRAGVDRA